MKAEGWEIFCSCSREEIQCAETMGFRVGNHALDERSSESQPAPNRIDGSGAEQSITAALLEPGDANELAAALRYDE